MASHDMIYEVHTKAHEGRFGHSGNIKVNTPII
jgi:hypothetical protein